ncbi:hypothetical protein ACGFJ7_19490 [Actinoplanes sp. NPDC048988]|uniref:hypothetical protein n=1 Tax=Actinoplanes sp. NPDC048988 TaxID=3363901 RepID=UPI0037125E4D
MLRRALDGDERFDTALVGTEARYAAVATDNALARRRTVRISDLAATRWPWTAGRARPRPRCGRPGRDRRRRGRRTVSTSG